MKYRLLQAKIIGVDDVAEPRGDKMCQESLQKLKAVVKVSGEHKQRIVINVSLEGLKLMDEKTGVRSQRWLSGKSVRSDALLLFISGHPPSACRAQDLLHCQRCHGLTCLWLHLRPRGRVASVLRHQDREGCKTWMG